MQRLIVIVSSLSMLFGSGCAAMFQGTKDTIAVRSEEPGTKLYLDGMLIGTNSTVVQVPKKGDHMLEARKDGCSTSQVPIPYSFDPTTLLGLLLDAGLISILIVDGLATGAAMSASQTNFVVTPDCPTQG